MNTHLEKILLGNIIDIPDDIEPTALLELVSRIVEGIANKKSSPSNLILQLNALFVSMSVKYKNVNSSKLDLLLSYYLKKKIREIIIDNKLKENSIVNFYTSDKSLTNPLMEPLVDYGISPKIVTSIKKILESVDEPSLSKEIISTKLNLACNAYINKNEFLLKNDVNERSITHKFAECLTPLFTEWDVDCEYNLIGNNEDIKMIKTIQIRTETLQSDDTAEKTIYPDIIIHHGGKIGSENNLLVIEAKKNPSKKENDDDVAKIKTIMKELRYKFGVFLRIETGKETKIIPEFINLND